MFGTLQQGTPTVNFSAGRVWTKSHERVVQPGWLLSFLGHNKSPSKPVERHSPASVSNDLSCLASFWCSQHQSRAEGNKTWSCWNPALPRHNIISARPLGCCLKHVQQCNHHAGSKITQDLFKDIQLLMLLYLMPTSCYWQSVWSLQNWIYRFSFPDSDLSVRPKNPKLFCHNNEWLSSTVNYHAKPIYCICTKMNMQAM